MESVSSSELASLFVQGGALIMLIKVAFTAGRSANSIEELKRRVAALERGKE